jgi:predicted GNAT family acetyltransferase
VASCGGTVHAIDGLAVCLTGVPAPWFNATVVEGPVRDPASALAAASAVYPVALGFGIEIHPVVDAEIRRAAGAAGLRPIVTEPVMAVAPQQIVQTPMPSGVEIVRVHDHAMLDELARVDVEGFGGELAVTRRYLPDALLDDPAQRAYVAVLDGTPVAAGETNLGDGVLGVFGIATVPAARRRGIAAALTAHLIEDRAGEADLATLSASPVGRGVYERLGFRTIMRREVWGTPAPDA